MMTNKVNLYSGQNIDVQNIDVQNIDVQNIHVYV